MTVYGDLDVSVLDELPPGRTPIVTRWAGGPLLEAEAWAAVREEVAAGRQAYVVCPLIEESEKLEVASAEETYDRLAGGELAGLRLGLLHGRMTSAEKEQTMERVPRRRPRRARGDDRHRGRRRRRQRDGDGHPRRRPLRHRPAAPAAGPGRARRPRVAVLAGHDAERRADAAEHPRVEALVASTDGFELAEVDLDLRGEGTLMSSAQKGRSDLRLASLRRDRDLVAAGPRRGVRDRRRRPACSPPTPACSTSWPSSSPTRTPSSSPAADRHPSVGGTGCRSERAQTSAHRTLGSESSTASSSRTRSQRSRQSAQR